MSQLIVSQAPFTRKLTANGTAGGDANANSDYSVVGAEFYYAPAVGEVLLIKSLTARLTSSGSIDPGKYSGLAALTVGVQIYVSADAVGVATFDLTGNSPIKTNAGYQEHFTFTDLMGAVGASQKVLSCRWDFGETFDSQGLIISGNKGERIAVYFNDDLSPGTNVSTEHLIHGVFLSSHMGYGYVLDQEV